MLDNLTVKQKLLAGFTLVLILLTLMGIVAIQKMGMMHANMQGVANDNYPKVELSNDIVKNALDIGRLVRNGVFVGPDKIEGVIQNIEENRKKNTEDISKLGAMLVTAKGKEILNRTIATRQELSTHYTALYVHLRADDDKAAIDYILNVFAPSNSRFIATLDEMVKYQSEQMEQAKTDAEHSYQQAKIFVLSLGALALLLGVVIAVVIANQMSAALQKAMTQAGRIADGNLAPNPDALLPPGRNEINILLGSLETMRSKLVSTISDIQNNANQVSDSARALTSISGQVSTSAQQQAESTSAAAATLEQLTVSINHVADNASDASSQASQAGVLAQQGGHDVELSVNRIQTVSSSVEDTATEMESLTKEVQEIGNIVTVIRDVADQTNLLALNAAIEAARAGETGRGFAVVADEVRKLAERTTVSAQEITRMVSSIQQNANRVVGSMEQSRQSVSGVTESASRTSSVMNQVQESANGVLGAVSNINGALTEQRGASQELAQSMESVARKAEENSATVEELAATSGQLLGMAQSLQNVVSRFRLL